MELKKSGNHNNIETPPYGWHTKTLNEVANYRRGSFPQPYGLDKWYDDINGLPFVQVFDVDDNNRLKDETKRYISLDAQKMSVFVKKGSIVLTIQGSIGRIALTQYDAYVDRTLLIFESFKTNFDPYFFMLSVWQIFEIEKKSAPGGIIKTITKDALSSFKISFPNIDEQRAIANALSDADAYITSLEKLIEKKRQIKQGAMQELLKPKDGWAWKKLGDIGKTYGGLSGKSKDDFKDGVFPYIPFMNIMTNPVIDLEFLDFVNLKTGESQNSAQIGDLFFNGSSETPEEVGMCSILQDEVPNLYLNSFCFGYRLKKELNINGLYLTYYFRSKEGRKLFFSMAQGATRYNLSKSNFNRLEVPIPTIEEQNSIANTLRDMDFDIKLHEEKLDKARSIKQGMMQQLLTGKIRII